MVPADGSDGTPAVATVDPGEEDNANTQETKMLPKEEEGGVKKMVRCRCPVRDVGLKCELNRTFHKQRSAYQLTKSITGPQQIN